MIYLYINIIIVILIGVFLDLLVTRISGNRKNGYVTSFLVILIGTPLSVIHFNMVTFDFFLGTLALGISLMWWFIYLNVVQAVESSLRIRVLNEINDKGGSLTINALNDSYNDERLILIRLERLQSGGAIIVRSGKRHLQSDSLLKSALLFAALKRIILNRNN